MQYNWQQPDWTKFSYSIDQVEQSLLQYLEKNGRIGGLVHAVPETSRVDIAISSMVLEALKTSEIEGEYFSREDVASSIRNNLGLNPKLKKVGNQAAAGIAQLIMEISRTYNSLLDFDTLFSWHKMLMSGNTTIQTGAWRTHSEPMQIVSGPMGNEKVHFEAPPSMQVPKEMEAFVRWFNDTSPSGKNPILHAPVRASIAHLYFESIHPFEDGNGRIGRALSEKVLFQHSEKTIPISLSSVIEANKKLYYSSLEKAQKSNEISDWIVYFVQTTIDAQIKAEEHISFVIKKAQFFDEFKSQMNARQHKVVARMLEEGENGFTGGLNARKYIAITKTSKATATRDLQDLLSKDILVTSGGGRSTNYQVNL